MTAAVRLKIPPCQASLNPCGSIFCHENRRGVQPNLDIAVATAESINVGEGIDRIERCGKRFKYMYSRLE